MSDPNNTFDICIIGGGIVGLATALALTDQQPALRVGLLEKEPRVSAHQTGHNSGVVHAGIYYKPGSLKAKLCISGVEKMKAFCEAHALPYERCGKVIVATSERELPALEALFERAQANGVPGVRCIDQRELKEIEPNAAGIMALHSPNTAIVDYGAISRRMAAVLKERGVTLMLGRSLTGLEDREEGLGLQTSKGPLHTRYLINCAGLYSDKVAQMAGLNPDVQIVPFRGEYYVLKEDKRHLVNGLIYPVPDPAFPFLGVHLTKMVDGGVEAGPNAVLALAREGYTHAKLNPKELLETLSYSGFWHITRKFYRIGAYEYYRSFSKGAFLNSLRKLLPSLAYEDIQRAGAGVRAQAVTKEGKLADDFVIQTTPKSLHVLNAPSPAATASLAIGEYIVTQLGRADTAKVLVS